MSDNNTSWLDRVPLDAISIAVMIASMFLDGAYLRRFAYGGWFGTLCAYTLNCVADLAVNKLTREFVRLRLTNLGKWRGRLTFALLLFAFSSFYYTSVFSWREASLQMPNEPNWLLWSIATFAPTTLAGLGVAEALRGKRATSTKVAAKAPTVAAPEPEPKPIEPPVALEPVKIAKPERLERLVEVYGSTPKLPHQQAGEMFGVSRQQIGNDLTYLEQSGRIRRNGHGVEVN